MTNKEKTKEIANIFGFSEEQKLQVYGGAMKIAEQKDEKISKIIECKIDSLIAKFKG